MADKLSELIEAYGETLRGVAAQLREHPRREGNLRGVNTVNALGLVMLEAYDQFVNAAPPELKAKAYDIKGAVFRWAGAGLGSLVRLRNTDRRPDGMVTLDEVTDTPPDADAVDSWMIEGRSLLADVMQMEQFSSTVEQNPPAPDAPPLDETDLAMLQAMNESPHTLKNVELAERAGFAEATIKAHLPRLMKLGYVARKGERGGVTITPAGKARL